MGGYWSLRAAAFEKRISRVIAFPPVYDWLEMADPVSRGLVRFLMKQRRLMNSLIRLKMLNGKLNQVMRHTLFLIGQKRPIEAADWFMAMNKQHLHSERVEQDVLLLGGENDAFQKPVLLTRQEEALGNAKSVATRIFTREEQGDQHCQIGNLGLALQTMAEWLDKH